MNRTPEQYYTLLAEEARDLLFILDMKEGAFLYGNKAFQEFLLEVPEESLKPRLLALEEPFPDLMEMALGNILGDQVWLELSLSLYEGEGERLLLGSARNIQDRKEAEEEIRELGYYDSLTGALSRNYFMTQIDRIIHRGEKSGKPLSLLMLDLDHFKDVNDTYGHPVGDEVLKETARLIQGRIRSADHLVRFGGEEFLILLEGTDLSGAARAAEKVRMAMGEGSFPEGLKITASLGGAQRLPEESFLQWYKRTDDALYAAKNGGRNRVELSHALRKPLAALELEWQPEMASGHPVLDSQHKELLALGQRLLDSVLAQRSEEETLTHLQDLLAHTQFHFQYEEGILEEKGYPEVEQHTLIHKELLNKAGRLAEAAARGEAGPTAYISFILDDVLLGHLLRKDSQFFPYVEEPEANE